MAIARRRHRKRHAHVATIRAFLFDVAAFTRFARYVRRFVANVRRAQRAVRSFLRHRDDIVNRLLALWVDEEPQPLMGTKRARATKKIKIVSLFSQGGGA
jgi:hypothetical protein